MLNRRPNKWIQKSLKDTGESVKKDDKPLKKPEAKANDSKAVKSANMSKTLRGIRR